MAKRKSGGGDKPESKKTKAIADAGSTSAAAAGSAGHVQLFERWLILCTNKRVCYVLRCQCIFAFLHL